MVVEAGRLDGSRDRGRNPVHVDQFDEDTDETSGETNDSDGSILVLHRNRDSENEVIPTIVEDNQQIPEGYRVQTEHSSVPYRNRIGIAHKRQGRKREEMSQDYMQSLLKGSKRASWITLAAGVACLVSCFVAFGIYKNTASLVNEYKKELEDCRDDSRSERDTWRQIIVDLLADLRHKSHKLDACENDRSKLDAKLKEAIHETQKLGEMLQDKEADIEEFKTELKKATDKIQNLTKMLDKKEGNVKDLKDELDKATKLAEKLEGNLEDKEIENKGLRANYKVSQDKAQTLSKVVEEYKKKEENQPWITTDRVLTVVSWASWAARFYLTGK